MKSTLSFISLAFILFLVVGCSALPFAASEPIAPQAYLEDVLDWMQANALRRDELDWTTIRAEAMTAARDAGTTADTYDAIRAALKQLGSPLNNFLVTPADNEAWQLGSPRSYGFNALPSGVIFVVWDDSTAARAGVRAGDTIKQWNGEPFASDMLSLPVSVDKPIMLTLERPGVSTPIEVSVQSEVRDGEPHPAGTRLAHGQARIGYLELPGGGNETEFPVRAQELIKQMDEQGVCGWVVDLRRQSGGNFWSMLGALGPMIGADKSGEFAGPGIGRKVWSYRNGQVFEDDKVWFQTRNYQLARAASPVAILTGPATIASGEMILLALRDRPNTRSFGEPTAGSSAFLVNLNLPDKAFLIIEAGLFVDKAGKQHSGAIAPDEHVRNDFQVFGTPNDAVLQSALEWLGGQPGCNS